MAALREHLPAARVTGIAAGLHAVVRVPVEFDPVEVATAAGRASVGVYPLAWWYARPPARDGALVLGYANLGEAAIREGVRRLARVLENCAGLTKTATPSAPRSSPERGAASTPAP